jgi:hypothetical protein
MAARFVIQPANLIKVVQLLGRFSRCSRIKAITHNFPYHISVDITPEQDACIAHQTEWLFLQH